MAEPGNFQRGGKGVTSAHFGVAEITIILYEHKIYLTTIYGAVCVCVFAIT